MAQHSALDASGTRVGARAGSAAGPRTAAGASPRLRGSGSALWCPVNLFVAICVLLPVFADSAPTMQQFKAHTPFMRLCPPGSHVSDVGGNCTLCQSGVEYTSHWNALFSCLRCSVCNPDEDEMSPCTRTRDAQCRCKPGTFRGEDVPEFCQKCKTGCPKGMVEAHPCTPWGDLQCVHQGSGTKGTGEGTISQEPVDSGLGSPASPSPSSGVPSIKIGSVVVLIILVGVCVSVLLWWRCTCQGCGNVSEYIATEATVWTPELGSLPPQGHEKDLALPTRAWGSGQCSEPDAERLADHPGLCPGKPRLGAGRAAGSHCPEPCGSRASPGLKLFFYFCPDLVPFDSWTWLMRLLGWTDNEMKMAKAHAARPEDEFYKILATKCLSQQPAGCLGNTGREKCKGKDSGPLGVL
ncbi:tumor necrosis factor receptor superfamily member 10B-like isoform X2 [Choloepus didactylus]|nr:tumor necrosis factor receptor superfamily member 10B-like isoform X2 [Choloepus didactylus]